MRPYPGDFERAYDFPQQPRPKPRARLLSTFGWIVVALTVGLSVVAGFYAGVGMLVGLAMRLL
jgi:hypothetical protein